MRNIMVFQLPTPGQLPDGLRRVLVVDDVVEVRRLLRGYLEDFLHLSVVEADTGGSAFAAAVDFKPHLILLDATLPDMTGYEVCQRLKADPLTSNIPVVFVSASDCRDSQASAIQAGACAFITKGGPLKDWLASLNSLLGEIQSAGSVLEGAGTDA